LRENSPSASPPPNVRAILGAAPAGSAPPFAASAPPATAGGSGPSGLSGGAPSAVASEPVPAAEATPGGADRFFSYAQVAAADRNGATDRAAIDAIALRIWRSDLGLLLTGIGLEVFLLVSPYTPIGVPVII